MNDPAQKAQANRLIDDIVRQAEERAAAPTPAPRRTEGKWLGRALSVAIPLLTVFTIGNIATLYSRAGPPDPADAAALRFELYLLAEEIEHFRESSGGLPESLEELGFEDPALTYSLDGVAFSLSANDEGMIVNYRPGDPDDDRFAAELASLSRPRET